MIEQVSKDIGCDARKLDYLSRAINNLSFCLRSDEQECYLATECMIPEFRITIPNHLKREIVSLLLDYYTKECNVLISNLQLYKL